MKIQLGPTTFLFPVPAALITSSLDAKNNVFTVAWISMISLNPPMLAIAVNPKRFSYEIIKKTGEFCVNIPQAELFAKVDYCGVKSGRNIDKFEKLGLTPMPAKRIKAPIIKECPYNIECILKKELSMGGSNNIFIGEIVETHLDKDKTQTTKGKIKPDIAKINPLACCTGLGEYWGLNKKIGDAYSSWKLCK